MHFLLNFWILIIAFIWKVIGRGHLGFSISTRKLNGNCKDTNDYLEDILLSKQHSLFIRLFSISDCNCMEKIMPVIISNDMKIILGIWPGGVETEQFRYQLSLLKGIPREHVPYIYAISVGSEVLYRKDYSSEILLDQINAVRELLNEMDFKSIKLGTADTWNVFADGTANKIIGFLDIAFLNSFPYWQGHAIEHSAYSFFADISNAIGVVRSIKHNIEVWIGESGWPTDGVTYGAAVPSVENAAYFWVNVICTSLFNNLNVVVFELTDEPWKGDAIGLSGQSSNVEKFWGVFTIDKIQKYSLECPKESEKVIPYISSNIDTSPDSGNTNDEGSKVDSGDTNNEGSKVDSGDTNNEGSKVDSGDTNNEGSKVDSGNTDDDSDDSKVDSGDTNNEGSKVDSGNTDDDSDDSKVDSGNTDDDIFDEIFGHDDSSTDSKEPNKSFRILFCLKNTFYLSFTTILFLFFFY